MDRILAALNAAALVPAVVFLILASRYLIRESTRRGLHPLNWFNLPHSMNLALAMVIFDIFVILRLGTTVLWYMIGQKILPIELMFLVSIIGIIVGLLCKIRALTEPEYGRLPWLGSAVLTILAAVFLLALWL